MSSLPAACLNADRLVVVSSLSNCTTRFKRGRCVRTGPSQLNSVATPKLTDLAARAQTLHRSMSSSEGSADSQAWWARKKST